MAVPSGPVVRVKAPLSSLASFGAMLTMAPARPLPVALSVTLRVRPADLYGSVIARTLGSPGATTTSWSGTVPSSGLPEAVSLRRTTPGARSAKARVPSEPVLPSASVSPAESSSWNAAPGAGWPSGSVLTMRSPALSAGAGSPWSLGASADGEGAAVAPVAGLVRTVTAVRASAVNRRGRCFIRVLRAGSCGAGGRCSAGSESGPGSARGQLGASPVRRRLIR
ncbi:hypothetical protein DEJ51_30955 [Streptomyces venezuelae]|uniref:Uncharacterized protein n=1 Tax=Streptomyces venezuelae TaxID=54571 RepID=A0A5P2DS59_STRVZ|nr:hypothetical protein DEJ51_30955 [Streptomyces venezuelae]